MLSKLISWWFILCFVVSAVYCQDTVITVSADHDEYDTYSSTLRELFVQPLHLFQVSFNADVYMQQEEFAYLTELKAGETVCHKDIAKAIYYLLKKQKFESITLTSIDSPQGAKLHFELVSYWTLKKLKFKGIFVGKEYYRQYYLMEPGDRFDHAKHEESIKKIVDSLKNEGYFAACVFADLIYDKYTKSITVCLRLQKGHRFSVASVDIVFDSALLPQEQKDCLRDLVLTPCAQPLLNSWYHHDTVDARISCLQELLVKQECLHVDIELDEHINYDDETVDLIFKVHVHDIKKFRFIGNQFYTHEQLLNVIVAFGRSASLLPASILSEEIIRVYHDKGFWQIHIEAVEDQDVYSFIIQEGERARIVDVEIRNLCSFDARYIAKRFFTSVLKKEYYDVSVVDKAIDELLAYLLTRGFWQATLLHRSCQNICDSDYRLTLTFDEKEQNFLKGVTIAGFEHLAQQSLFKQCNEQSNGIPFNLAIIDQQRAWLKQHFQKEGYYQPKVKPTFDKQQKDVHVTWHVDLSNAQSDFGKTVLLGATRFPFSYVKRELDYKIGDPWHTNVVRHSVGRLQKLEIFESIQLFPDKQIDCDKERAMLLKLQLDDPFEVKARIGGGLQHVTKSLTTGGPTYRVGGSFIWKNPCNRADQFRLDADFTKAIRLVNVQYRLPWLFGLPIDAMLQGYTNKFEYPGFIGSQKNLYTVIQQGCLLNLNSVFNVVDAALSTGFEIVDTFIDESQENVCFTREVARAINFQPELLDKNIPFFLIQPTCIIFYLDSTINPTRGSFSVLSAKGMFPMAKLAPSNFFIRFLIEQSFFIPCRPFVFAIRFRVGHIFHPKFSTIIPIERFYLGGANSIRSYETDQCPPLGAVCDNGKELFVPQGGRSLANLNLEVRFPLYRQFNGVFFGDIGALSNNRLAEIKAQDLLSGIGFGIRYNTAIGPLRFDFAWRGNKHDGVGRPYAWFLSFGNAFI